MNLELFTSLQSDPCSQLTFHLWSSPPGEVWGAGTLRHHTSFQGGVLFSLLHTRSGTPSLYISFMLLQPLCFCLYYIYICLYIKCIIIYHRSLYIILFYKSGKLVVNIYLLSSAALCCTCLKIISHYYCDYRPVSYISF